MINLLAGVESFKHNSAKGVFSMSATATPKKRKFIDCREYPSDKNCSLKISGTEDEVLDAAVAHATVSHGHENSPELRNELRRLLKEE
jgi:predicted small metal-binding protein